MMGGQVTNQVTLTYKSKLTSKYYTKNHCNIITNKNKIPQNSTTLKEFVADIWSHNQLAVSACALGLWSWSVLMQGYRVDNCQCLLFCFDTL